MTFRVQDLLYRALNPPMRALLRSPLHGVASRNLAILRYRGKQSGRAYETPLSYVRTGHTVCFLSSRNTRWWLNFRGAAGDGVPVEVEMAREVFGGHARLQTTDPREGTNRTAFLGAVRDFLTALPRDAVVYGVGLDEKRRPKEDELEAAADHIILVEVTLST